MEKSIETIWKQGFLKSDALVAPKLNDLYNQKSKHTVDKIMKIGKINLVGIIIAASVLLLISIYADVPLAGVIIFSLLIWLVIYGKKQVNNMKEIDKNLSSYEYIKSVDTWVKEVMSGYTKIYRIFYPAFILTFGIAIGFSTAGEETTMFDEIISNSPEISAIFGIPLFWLIGLIILGAGTSIFAKTLYTLDMNLVYGRVFKKLDDLIEDMEELKA